MSLADAKGDRAADQTLPEKTGQHIFEFLSKIQHKERDAFVEAAAGGLQRRVGHIERRRLSGKCAAQK